MFETGTRQRLDFAFPGPDGLHYYQARLLPELDEDGEAESVLCVTTDITEQHRIEAEKHHLAFLVENCTEFVGMCDLEGRPFYVNAYGLDLVGLTFEEMQQTAVRDFFFPEDQAFILQEFFPRVIREGHSEVEVRLRHFKTGEAIWILYSVYVMKDADGSPTGYATISRNISERRRTEAEIALLNQRLHRAVYESSHRIKNQLQVLAATVDMSLLDDRNLIPSEEFQRLGTQIRTLAVLQDILTLEWKADATGAVEVVSSQKMLERVLELLRQTSCGIQVTYRIADRGLSVHKATSLALVCNEVVANAIKHGRQSVEALFQVEEETGVLDICDDGPGFPEGFDPHTAANTGLELISSLVLHDLKGVVHYGNRAEGGARVRITFPIN